MNKNIVKKFNKNFTKKGDNSVVKNKSEKKDKNILNQPVYFKGIHKMNFDTIVNSKLSPLYNPVANINNDYPYPEFVMTNSPAAQLYEYCKSERDILLKSDKLINHVDVDSLNFTSSLIQIDMMIQELMIAVDTVYKEGFYKSIVNYLILESEISSLFNILDQSLMICLAMDIFYCTNEKLDDRLKKSYVSMQEYNIYILNLVVNTYYDIIGALSFSRTLAVKQCSDRDKHASYVFRTIPFDKQQFMNDKVDNMPENINIITYLNKILLNIATEDIKKIEDLLDIILFKARNSSFEVSISDISNNESE